MELRDERSELTSLYLAIAVIAIWNLGYQALVQ